MALTNHDRVSKAMKLLHDALGPYVRREMKAEYKIQWFAEVEHAVGRQLDDGSTEEPNLDISALLSVMQWRWNEVFGKKLSQADRSLVHELRDIRNRWAHQDPFSTDDAYRALDSAHRLLSAIAAPEAAELDAMKAETLRAKFNEQARSERRRRASGRLVEQTTGSAGLTPWRDIMTPHPDVAGGNYLNAEYAADLSQVHAGTAAPEYQDPRNFFQRTYLTKGLKTLLGNALNRLHDHADGRRVGDPVIKLQTNFGGGKTHSMLALYHLFSEVNTADLPGVDELLAEAGIDQPARANRAVLVGTALGPGQQRKKPDGTLINTLWGEMAWQLLGAEGYQLVAESDRRRTSPGADTLRVLFRQSEPSLILIDEWVAFIRQLGDQNDLPAGTFDTNIAFVQALAEAVSGSPGTLLVASLPQSDIEVGGEFGKAALDRLEHVFHRIESTWRPADTRESYEIVRRRLFQELTDPDLSRKRDAVIDEMVAFYGKNRADFPAEVRERTYRDAMRAAYPIHPELFERLHEDWGSLDKFQRTRGVLRLMSSVIHVLWERGDQSPMIMPGLVPLDHANVREELLHYLDPTWSSVVEKDVDGEGALPGMIDQENAASLGRFQATKRVARTIFLGSAPIPQAANRGIDERRIRLGAAQPGESPAVYGDALRRLRDRATYLYVDGDRHWYATQPTVTKLAQDRALQQKPDEIAMEIIRRLRAAARSRSEFHGVHVAPQSSGDVPDEREVRLVILDPEQPHISKDDKSPAMLSAKEILQSRGTGPRMYKNTLVFLAPDATRVHDDLEATVRQYLAWQSINDEREQLNLDAFQTRQAETRLRDMDERIDQQIPETYSWLLVPVQPDPHAEIEWDAVWLRSSDTLAERAANRLKQDSRLVTMLGAPILKMRLDGVPLWGNNDHVSVRQLQDYYAQYLYLERLRDPQVLIGAIQQGVGQLTWRQDGFAYAGRWNPETERYEGLVAGQNPAQILADGNDVLIKADVAARQIDVERAASEGEEARAAGGDGRRIANGGDEYVHSEGATGTVEPQQEVERPYTRFFGAIEIDDHDRFVRLAGDVGEAIVAHLAGKPKAKVRVSIEIEAEIPGGADDHLRRTVSENARTLGFRTSEFERE